MKFMPNWPKSLPDYQWPAECKTPRARLRRFLLACAFHFAYLMGLIAGLFDGRRDRILVIRTDGLGDGLLFEPALESLSQAMPNRQLHLWAPALTCELFGSCPFITRLFAVPRGFKSGNRAYFRSLPLRLKLGFALGRWTFDKAIYPVQSPEPLGNWLLLSARAEQRWVSRGDTIHQFDWQRSRVHERAALVLDDRVDSPHELLRNEHLARQWNDRRQLRSPRVHLTIGDQAQTQAQFEQWREQVRKVGGRRLLGVVPSASMTLNSYPQPAWISVLSRLWQEDGMLPVLLGGPGDRPSLDSLADELRCDDVPHVRYDHDLKLLEIAALIARLDGVLSVDTGLAHIAVAQHVPTVVLAGGGNPGRFFPWPEARHHVSLNVPMPCDGCNNRCIWKEASCITLITPQRIVDAIRSLREPRVVVKIKLPPLPIYQQAG